MPYFSNHQLSQITTRLESAKTASTDSNFPHHHLGAVAYYRGAPLAKGYNSLKTSPVQKKFNRERDYDVDTAYNSLHAECACLNKIKYLDIDFSKVELYVYREHKNGIRALAKPCPACRKFIQELGIKNVYYTIEDGWCYERIE